MQNEADLIARRVKWEEELIGRARRTLPAPGRWALAVGAILLLASTVLHVRSLHVGLTALRLSLTEEVPELESALSSAAVDGLAGDLVALVGSGLAVVFLISLGLWLQSQSRINALYELLDRAGSLRRRETGA